MPWNLGLLSGHKGRRGFRFVSRERVEIDMPQGSIEWVLEYIRRVPDTRPDKVDDLRRRLASGSWDPSSTRLAEKILFEHLFDPEPN
jgi:hypothetical protein